MRMNRDYVPVFHPLAVEQRNIGPNPGTRLEQAWNRPRSGREHYRLCSGTHRGTQVEQARSTRTPKTPQMFHPRSVIGCLIGGNWK
jgi:hypothetical protein